MTLIMNNIYFNFLHYPSTDEDIDKKDINFSGMIDFPSFWSCSYGQARMTPVSPGPSEPYSRNRQETVLATLKSKVWEQAISHPYWG